MHVAKKMTEGFVYNLANFIAKTILVEAHQGDKIIFGVILLSIVFFEIVVPNGPKDKIWQHP